MNDNYFNYNQINYNFNMKIKINNIDNTYSNNLFHQLLKEENIIELKNFLKKLNLDDICNNQYNILSSFIKENRRFSYEQLLDLFIFFKELGIDFNIKNNIGYTPLSFCIRNKDINLAKILINFEKNKVFNDNQNYIIHLSVINSLYNITQMLLEIDYENNTFYKDEINDEDLTPLMIAVLNKDINMINLLFEFNINPNIQNLRGTTALMYACNSLNKNKHSINENNTENILTNQIINILINNGSNINIVDSLNQTALNYACSYIDDDTLNKTVSLLDAGANPNICDIYGNTPLLNISQNIYNNNHYYLISIMMILIKYGSDITLTNSNGYSIYDLMSSKLSTCFNLVYKIDKKSNLMSTSTSKNKLFISKKCLICFEEKENMVLFNNCHHSVTCYKCYQILKMKNINLNNEYIYEEDIENNMENNMIKCPYCNLNNNIHECQVIDYI
jgi:ankyrin repeat protein